MYYLVNVDHNSMAMHLTRSDRKVFSRCCLQNGMDETYDVLWNDSEENGNVKSECEDRD